MAGRDNEALQSAVDRAKGFARLSEGDDKRFLKHDRLARLAIEQRAENRAKCGEQIAIARQLHASSGINLPWKKWAPEAFGWSYATIARRLEDYRDSEAAARRREVDATLTRERRRSQIMTLSETRPEVAPPPDPPAALTAPAPVAPLDERLDGARCVAIRGAVAPPPPPLTDGAATTITDPQQLAALSWFAPDSAGTPTTQACSFCKTPWSADKVLISSAEGVCICDECVDQCVKLIAERGRQATTAADLAPEPAAEAASPGLAALLDAWEATSATDRVDLNDWVMRADFFPRPAPDATAEFNYAWRVALEADQKAFRKYLVSQPCMGGASNASTLDYVEPAGWAR
jgi:hypothetical protein